MSVTSWCDVDSVFDGGKRWALEYYDSVANEDIKAFDKLVHRHKIDINKNFTEAREQRDISMCPVHLASSLGRLGRLIW